MTHVRVSIAKGLRGSSRRLSLLVDSGAIYSVLPRPTLLSVGIRPFRKETFRVADGRRIVRDVGIAVFRCHGTAAATQVIFGERGDASVLGVMALEELGLERNPRSGRVRKAELLLLGVGTAAGI